MLEGLLNLFSLVHEVQDKRLCFAGSDAIEAGKRLHGINATELLIHIHRMQERLVEPCLELVCHDEESVLIALERFLTDTRATVDAYVCLGDVRDSCALRPRRSRVLRHVEVWIHDDGFTRFFAGDHVARLRQVFVVESVEEHAVKDERVGKRCWMSGQ